MSNISSKYDVASGGKCAYTLESTESMSLPQDEHGLKVERPLKQRNQRKD